MGRRTFLPPSRVPRLLRLATATPPASSCTAAAWRQPSLAGLAARAGRATCPPASLLSAQAVNAYQRLSSLLRGEYPPGLLPPTPQGYIAARIRQLAGGAAPLPSAFVAQCTAMGVPGEMPGSGRLAGWILSAWQTVQGGVQAGRPACFLLVAARFCAGAAPRPLAYSKKGSRATSPASLPAS